MSTVPTALIIPNHHWTTIIDHLRAALPREGVGLLACAESDTDRPVVTRVFPGNNMLASSTRYVMEPREVIDAFRAMREQNLRLAAIFHSHPTGPTTLSPTDLREAAYVDSAFIVVSFAGGAPKAAAWRLVPKEGGFVPEGIALVLPKD